MPPYFSVKEAVFPFVKFPGVDPILGPEMRSTGEVMGVGQHVRRSARSSRSSAAGSRLPESGTVLLTVKNADKPRAVEVARELHELGFRSSRPRARRRRSRRPACRCKVVNKVKDGRPHIVDMIKNGEIALVFTTVDETPHRDRRFALDPHERAGQQGHVLHDDVGRAAAVEGMRYLKDLEVYDLQGLHARLN